MATSEPENNYRTQILRPLLLAASILLVSVIWLFAISYHLIQINQDRIQVDEARLVIEKFTRAVVDAETGQRGYLLTGHPSFLDPYNGAYEQAIADLRAMRALSSFYPEFTSLEPQLQSLVDRKFQSIESSFKIQLNAGSYAPHLHLSKDPGEGIMLEIRKLASNADRQLLEQKRSIERSIHQDLMQVIVGAGFTVAAISLILFFGYRHIVYLFERAAQMQTRANNLQQQVTIDSLTKIPNRRGFEECVQNHFALAQRTGMPFAIFYLDLDGFKAINDQHGHDAGDQTLITAIDRFKSTIRDSDMIARLGGDEFALVAHNAADREQLSMLAHRLIESLEQPIKLPGGEVKLGVSIGIASYPQNGQSIDDLLTAADVAMYQAKHQGKNRACFSAGGHRMTDQGIPDYSQDDAVK